MGALRGGPVEGPRLEDFLLSLLTLLTPRSVEKVIAPTPTAKQMKRVCRILSPAWTESWMQIAASRRAGTQIRVQNLRASCIKEGRTISEVPEQIRTGYWEDIMAQVVAEEHNEGTLSLRLPTPTVDDVNPALP